MGSPLPHLSFENISRVLCVVAHPDDMEYGASAAVAMLTAAGVEVHYLLVTAGEAGIRDMEPARCAQIRKAEQERACDIVGVKKLTILDFPDGLVEHNLQLRAAIAEQIRTVRPDVIITMTWELTVGWGLNHADHRNVGLATVDAIRDADNPWLFTELAEAGLPAWSTQQLWVAAHDEPNIAVEVDQRATDLAVQSLQAHKLYLAALPDHMAPETFIPETLRAGGKAAGTDYAAVFRRYEF